MDAYRVLAEAHGLGDSERYRRILEFLMTPKQAEIATYLPASFEDLAQKSGLSVEEMKKEIDDLFRKGVVIPRDFHTLEGARFCRTIEQLHDATQSDQKTEEIYGERAPQLWELWEDFARNEWHPKRAQTIKGRELPNWRVVPAYKAIENIPGITPYDDVREILKANSPVATVPCSCRRQVKKTDVAVNTCVQFGRSAEYAIVRGSGWELDYEGALRTIDEAEESAEVHQWANWRTLSFGLMCNCEREACVNFRTALEGGIPIDKLMAKSRFEAVVEQELCTGCQVCIDRCNFDAIEMVKPTGSKKYKAVIDPEKCWGCGLCVIKCDPGALSFKVVRPLEHIPAERPAV